MKIKELLEKVTPEYVKSIADERDNMGHILDVFAEEFAGGQYVDYKDGSWGNAQEYFLEVPVHTWWCTDTIVGVTAIYINLYGSWEMVAITCQPARKCEFELFWISESFRNATRNIWEQMIETREQFKVLNYDIDIPEYYFKQRDLYRSVI